MSDHADGLMPVDDDAGMLMDILAGPFAGALFHGRDHYDAKKELTHSVGNVAGLGEAAHMVDHGGGLPWAAMVEGGLAAADGLNLAVHGDPIGGVKTAGKGIAEANGGIPGLLSHWIE